MWGPISLSGYQMRHRKGDEACGNISDDFAYYYKSHGSEMWPSLPYEPESSGIAERLVQQRLTCMLCYFLQPKLPDFLWSDVMTLWLLQLVPVSIFVPSCKRCNSHSTSRSRYSNLFFIHAVLVMLDTDSFIAPRQLNADIFYRNLKYQFSYLLKWFDTNPWLCIPPTNAINSRLRRWCLPSI